MRPLPLYLATLFVAATAALAAPAVQAAGLEVGTAPSAGDLDLPLYAGATARRDVGEDGHGIKLSLWGGTLGFKLAVAKYRSADTVDSVAAFYRDALARFGPVLDCSNPPARSAAASSDSKVLACEAGDKAEAGGRLYKAGTKANQRVVHIKPAGEGARGVDFDLVRLEARH